ncbi:hypothetical protein HK097_002106 [Rhizophlyctis rosea]|uniref:Sodium/calcium exchanger membrane region domain-containing protein n=1 Tax=Rhizophlyctis rosea TaxID=64517 RepID=A0AAD5S5S0_9FUNG|nr:hypothetical protein HK097_002106 [Rhizophlyctis rosea]
MERISSQASAAGATSSPRLQPRDNRDRERHVAHTSGLSPYVQPRYSTNPSLVSSPRLRPDGGDEGDDGEGWLRRRNVNARTWHGDHRERPERERTTTTSTGVPLPPPLPHAPNSTVNIDSKRRGSFSAAGGSVVVQRHAHGTAASTVAGHGGGGGGHDHPNWSLKKSFAVLLACTVLYSLVAEVLIDSLDVVLGAEEGEFEDGSGKGGGSIGEKFLGVTIVAIVPTVTEFYNAIAFSINDNIALSLEIGSAYAMQVALLQIPVMVGFSVWMGLSGGGGSSESEMVGAFGGAAEAGVMRVGANRFMLPKSGRLEGGKVSRTVDDGFRMPFRKYMEIFRRGFGSSAATPHSHAEPLVASSPSTSFVASSNPDPQTKPKSLKPFTLIFPKWDIATILFAVFLLTFIFNEGRSDYFKGSVLCVVYLICLGSFWVEGR